MITVKSLLEKVQNPDFWKNLNPNLSVSKNSTLQPKTELKIEQAHLEKLLLNLKTEGYFQIDALLSEVEVYQMATTVEKVLRAGLPAPFAFVYDEFWLVFCQLSRILSAILGEDYQQLPAFWAWYIEASNTEKGWKPHRDNLTGTPLPDGMPKCVTIWIPLSDAIPLNGCMYIVPATLDPNYNHKVQKGEKSSAQISYQDIRALPAKIGSVLCWNHEVLHWGGRSSERAPHPRISIAFEFQKADVEPYKTPLLDPYNLPSFNQRLGLIGKQILQYQHMYPLSEDISQLATELKKLPLPPVNNYQNNLPMDTKKDALTEKVRRQFDKVRYPNTPLEESPKELYELLFIHNLVTCYYLRNQKVIQTDGKVILDAGCGSGYKALILAEANPGAKIVGIDISEESVDLARERLQYHGYSNAEFYAMPIENLPSLGILFDYINNDEVLYLLPDIVGGLKAMRSVLKPDGIIRTNLHSSYQRATYFRAQKLFKLMGLMEGNPGELEIELTRDIMRSLKDDVVLKRVGWSTDLEQEDERVLMNYLLQGDKGYTIPEVFITLREADLEFISMVGWRQWELLELFKDRENLPAFLAMSLPEVSMEERLHIFELLHPIHRLIDFWCGHTERAFSSVPVSEWSTSDWWQAKVYLHPQLKTAQAKKDLLECVHNQKPFLVNRYVPLPTTIPISLESTKAACLLPLWEGPVAVESLVERWLKLRPLYPTTLESVSQEVAFEEVKDLLSRLEAFLYVLLECP